MLTNEKDMIEFCTTLDEKQTKIFRDFLVDLIDDRYNLAKRRVMIIGGLLVSLGVNVYLIKTRLKPKQTIILNVTKENNLKDEKES